MAKLEDISEAPRVTPEYSDGFDITQVVAHVHSGPGGTGVFEAALRCIGRHVDESAGLFPMVFKFPAPDGSDPMGLVTVEIQGP